MRQINRPLWLRYLFVLLSVLAVARARVFLSAQMHGWEGPPFTMMLGAVLFSAWYGGLWPGIIASVLGAGVCDYMFIEPKGKLLHNPYGYDIRLGIFIFEGFVISWMVQALRHVSAASRAMERNLRLIANNTSDVIFAYDMARQLMYVNPAFETVTGNSMNELRENPFMNYIHPDDSPRMQALFDGLFLGKSFTNVEYRIITHDGQVKWCRASWGPLLDEFGSQIGVQGRETDISDQKRSESTLRFLAEACAILSSNRDAIEALPRIARAAVGQFADWCMVDILNSSGMAQTVAAAHVDSSREPWLLEIQRDHAPRLDAIEGRGKVLASGQPIIMPSMGDDTLSAMAQDRRHLKLMQNLAPRTGLIVPLKSAAGKVLGAVTFARAQSGRSYTADDLIFALDLASRISASLGTGGRTQSGTAPAAETLPTGVAPAIQT